jgi:signal transduction histidine kinase
MRLSLKAKLAALISLLVLVVVVVLSAVYISRLVHEALAGVENRAEYVASDVFEQAREALKQRPLPPGLNPQDPAQLSDFVGTTLRQAPGLNGTLQTAIGTQNAIDYVSITDDNQGRVLVHSDPSQEGTRFTPGAPFARLLEAKLLHQLRVIAGPPRDYEVVMPLAFGRANLDIRVGVSTIFLRYEIEPELRKAVTVSLAAIVLATLAEAVFAYYLMRPLETIAHRVDRMAQGETLEPLRIERRDEWGILSSKLNLLGEQMRGEKAAFVALRDNLGQLFAKLADGLLFFDAQDRLVMASPAVARFLGRSAESLLHRPAAEVFSGDGPLDRLLADAFRTRRSVPREVVALDGAEVRRAVVSVQFAAEQGKPVATLVTLRDAATRERLESQIDLTTRLAALGRLTSGVAHEVKNPLNAMVLQIELLKAKLEGRDEPVRPHLRILSDEIRRLDRVVRTFLDFNRPVEIHPVETDIEALVREVLGLAEPQARQHNVRFVVSSNGPLPPVSLDRDLMKQALLNLVLNGCQAMPAGGTLTVAPRAESNRVEIEITDEGVGIPPEARPKIFSLYYTTKSGGTGIGLAMAYRIIQLHNGSIDFTSEVHRGTTFRVSLPV